MKSILKWFCEKDFGVLSLMAYGLVMVIIYDVGFYTIEGGITIRSRVCICNRSSCYQEFGERK